MNRLDQLLHSVYPKSTHPSDRIVDLLLIRPEGVNAVPAVTLRVLIWYSIPLDNSFFIITRSVRSIYTFNTKCLSAAHQSDFLFHSSRTEFAWGCAAGPRAKHFPIFFRRQWAKKPCFISYFTVFLMISLIFWWFVLKKLRNHLFLCFATVGSGSLLAYWAVFMVKYQGGEGSTLWLDLFLRFCTIETT